MFSSILQLFQVGDLSGTFLAHSWNTETHLLSLSNKLVLKICELYLNTQAGLTVVSILKYPSAHHSKIGCVFLIMPLVCQVHQIL